jgi:hypothetical protein
LENSKAWQAVRRALGRLVGHVGVRSVADEARIIPAPVLETSLTMPPPQIAPGQAWKPESSVCLALVPQAGMGLRESDLLPTVTVAQGDYALAPPAFQAMPTASAETVGVERILLDWPVGVTHLPESFVRLPSSPVRVGTITLLPLPKTMPLKAWQMTLPPVTRLPMPRLADPRVRWGGDSVLRRMPLTRHGQGIGVSVPEAFAAAQRRLAETAHLRAEEVALMGIYPNVPILAVERIVVEDEGRRLRLWLKPEVLRGRTGSHRIILLVGRQISTGKMLQAAL